MVPMQAEAVESQRLAQSLPGAGFRTVRAQPHVGLADPLHDRTVGKRTGAPAGFEREGTVPAERRSLPSPAAESQHRRPGQHEAASVRPGIGGRHLLYEDDGIALAHHAEALAAPPAILGGEIGRASRMVHHDELHGSRAGGITRLQPTGVSDRILRTVAHGQDALRIAGTRHGDAGKLRFGEHPPFGQIGIETPLGKFGIGPERNGHAHSTGRTAVEMHTPGEAQRRHSQRIEALSAVVVSVPRQQVRIFAVHAPIDQTPGMGRTPPGRQHLRTFGAIGFEQEGLAAGEDELRAVVLQHEFFGRGFRRSGSGDQEQ